MPKQKPASLDEIKEYFKDERLTEHLTQVFAKMIVERPEKPTDVFEEYSHFVKQNRYDPKDPGVQHKVEEVNKHYQANLKKISQLLEFEKKQASEEDEPAERKEAAVQNIQELFMVLKYAGVDFGADQAHLLQKSLNELAFGHGAKYVRLMGKIYGKNKDLWVAEMDEGKEDDADHNKYTYFVNEIPTGDWYRLPALEVNTLLQSQRVKRIISGDLNARLVTNPEFDGREKEFLRAQIARIAHSTTLVPDGLWDKGEEEGTVNPRDEESREAKSTADLSALENWVLLRPGILKNGLLKAKEEEGADDDDANKVEKEVIERLVKLDAPNLKDLWKVSMQGLTDVHKFEGKDVNYGVNVLSSVSWPGAMTVHYKGAFHNFYLGWGLKAKTQPFYPIYPPNIIDDPTDLDEHEEPWPRTIPQDDDKKDGDVVDDADN